MKRAITMSMKVAQYLEFRHALGFSLKIEGQQLRQFGNFADACGHQGPLTEELALRWAQSAKGCDRLYWARRLEIVRCFARHLVVTEPGTQVPERALLGPAHRRTTPHIYTARELAVLLTAARRLSPAGGLRPETYATLLGLLSCTGLRISEALLLTQADADLDRGVLTIRETKFCKTRLVPLHPTAVTALRAYANRRDRFPRSPECDHFFLSDKGRAMPYSTVRHTFRRLCAASGITGTPRRCPRLHDLRHTFACRRVEQWYRSGTVVDHAISALSVYLGHAKVTDTYWYLTATPDLMALAAGRFERFVQTRTEGTES
jgi:integrase